MSEKKLAYDFWNTPEGIRSQKIFDMRDRIRRLEASNAELLDVLEDFVIDVEGYFGFSETDDMQPENDVAYFIGEYRRAKSLINKEKGRKNDKR
jgi:hypothetical protein